MDNQLIKKIILTEINDGECPHVLYKYRTIKQAKQILTNQSFWFATADSFNDPFDCSLSDVGNYTIDDVIYFLREQEYDEAEINELVTLFNKDQSILDEFIASVTKQDISNRGILSLSENATNILMWSHYAQNHEGVAIGLELKNDLDFFVLPIKIFYHETYTPLDLLNDSIDSSLRSLHTKSIDWKYEQEYRIYKEHSGLYKINASAIKEIIFGVKTTDKDIRSIKRLCKKLNLTHVCFKKAYKIHGKFEIELRNT